MPRPTVFLSVLAFVLAAPATAAADTSVSWSSNSVLVFGSGDAMDLEIDSPAPNTLRFIDHSADDELSVIPGTPPVTCNEAPADTVTCSGLSTAQFNVEAFGSTQGDTIEVLAGSTFRAQLYGGGGNDVLLGGAGNDRFAGGLGNDEVDGREGSDHIDNGFDNSNAATADDGGDTYRDTGTSGQDTLNFGFQTVGVHASADNVANDGSSAGAEGDDVRGGFERLRGTKFSDVLAGGAGAEIINGSEGDDDLTGGAGADTIEGNEGVDTVRARDGEVDLVIDCDSASSVTQGAGESAFVDAADPEPLRCETVDRLGGGGGTPDPGAGGGATPDPGAGGSGTPAPPLVPIRLGAVNVTETVTRMPRVTGKKFTAARDEVLKVLSFAQVEIDFRRGCKKGDFLEVTKQTPLTGATLNADTRSPAQVTLLACIAEADYLRDCDMAGVKADVKRLGNKALDADVAMAVLGSVNKCKVDYDVKIAKANEEARIKLEAQKAADAKKGAADKVKADLRANITCPIGGNLLAGVIDGYTPSRNALGLKAAAFAGDPDAWTLPSNSRAAYQSFIEIVLADRAMQFPEAKVFLDTDDVTTDAVKFGGKDVKTTKDGHAVFSVRPQKPGFIRVCVVVETGADEVISTGFEIKVVGQPKTGTVYETQSGRRVKLTPDGPVAEKTATRSAQEPKAKKAFFAEIWAAIVRAFSGRSQTVNSQNSGGGEVRVRTQAAAETARVGVGQLTINGRLSSNPQPPALNPSGSCLSSDADGKIAFLKCPVLEAPAGTALIGMSNDGKGVMAFGHDNVVRAVPQNTILAGKGKLVGMDGGTLVGMDGATLVGPDGGTLVGPDGGTLIGQDGGSLVGPDGGTLVGNDGASVIARDGASLTAAVGPNALAVAPSQVIARDGASLLGGAAAGLVPPNGLK